jgi:hypothetical protein
MSNQRVIEAIAYREGKWWSIDMPDVPTATATRRMPDIEWMARECAALYLDVPEDSIDVHVTFRLPERVEERWRLARSKAEHARAEAVEAAELSREVIGDMRRDGFSLADIGRLLGVSAQRIGQIAGHRH